MDSTVLYEIGAVEVQCYKRVTCIYKNTSLHKKAQSNDRHRHSIPQ